MTLIKSAILAAALFMLTACANMDRRDWMLAAGAVIVAGYIIAKHNEDGGPVDNSCRRIQTPDGELLCVFRSN